MKPGGSGHRDVFVRMHPSRSHGLELEPLVLLYHTLALGQWIARIASSDSTDFGWTVRLAIPAASGYWTTLIWFISVTGFMSGAFSAR